MNTERTARWFVCWAPLVVIILGWLGIAMVRALVRALVRHWAPAEPAELDVLRGRRHGDDDPAV